MKNLTVLGGGGEGEEGVETDSIEREHNIVIGAKAQYCNRGQSGRMRHETLFIQKNF
jgi:hypothetical protein